MPLDLDFVRARFPALAGDWVYLDNAGGSQILGAVADRVRDYLLHTNVQHGATYDVSVRAEERVHAAERSLATLMNAADPAELVVGPSTSALLRTLASCLGSTLSSGDEIIVTNSDHEANIGPWVELERLGARIKFWKLNPDSWRLETETLRSLLSERTRLVAVPHVSNVLGTVNPLREWADLVHECGALLAVDGVAHAPHRLIDVQGHDADFYAFSFYKVYGPHLAVLYGKRDHLLSLPRFNHFFIANDDIPYKFQPGNRNYELTWGAGAIVPYLASLGGDDGSESRESLGVTFDRIEAHESDLGCRFLDWLDTKPRVRVIGAPRMTPRRVPTISFVVKGAASPEIPPKTDAVNIGIRWGDFYARRLIQDLGLEEMGGVVRVSMVHYNTLEEVERLITALDPWL